MNKQSEALRIKELGNQAYSNKQYKEAINHYTNAIKLNPQEPSFYSNRGLCYYNLGQFMDCINDCDNAIRLNPNFTKAYKKKASALANMLKFPEAVQTMKGAVNCDKGNQALKNELEEFESYESNYNRYMIAERNANYGEALSCATYLCNKLPQSKTLKMYRVEALAKTGETDEATTLLKSIPASVDPDVSYLKGIIELYGGDSGKAKKHFL